MGTHTGLHAILYRPDGQDNNPACSLGSRWRHWCFSACDRPTLDSCGWVRTDSGRYRVGIGWVATRDYALCSTHPMTEIATLHAPLDLGGVTGASPPALDRPWTAAGGYGRHRVAIGWVATRDALPTRWLLYPPEPIQSHPKSTDHRRGHFSGPSALAACLGRHTTPSMTLRAYTGQIQRFWGNRWVGLI